MPKRSLNLNDLEDTPISRARLRQTCCWPQCGNPSYEDAPLCSAHITVAHGMQIRIWNGQEALHKVRAILTQQEDEPEQTTEPEPIPGTVYYVQIGSHVKIGWTANMEGRMRKYPPNSVLLAQHPGTRKDENRMHRRFAADRTHGREWYVPSASLTRHIANVVREHGQPDAARFGAKPVEIPMPHRTQSQKMLARLGARHVS